MKYLWLFLPLLFGYLVLDNYVFSLLINWHTIPSSAYAYDLESLRKTFHYSAENIFSPGFVREVENNLYQRLSFDSGRQLASGQTTFSRPETVKLILPGGFQKGLLSLRASSVADFRIGISSDLKKWREEKYPGFSDLTYLWLTIENEASPVVYLKFDPASEKELTISFNVFQYLTNSPPAENEDIGVLFFPEVDIDYERKEIPREAIYAKKNPQPNR